MSSIIEISENVTEVRIIINAPKAAVESVVSDLAKEMNVVNDNPEIEFENVIQATKNWWFAQVVTQKAKQIEAYTQQLAEQTKAQLLDELNNSPLRGA